MIKFHQCSTSQVNLHILTKSLTSPEIPSTHFPPSSLTLVVKEARNQEMSATLTKRKNFI